MHQGGQDFSALLLDRESRPRERLWRGEERPCRGLRYAQQFRKSLLAGQILSLPRLPKKRRTIGVFGQAAVHERQNCGNRRQ